MPTSSFLVQLLKIIIPHSNSYQLPNLKSCACRKVLFNLSVDMPYLPLQKKPYHTNSINQVFGYYWLKTIDQGYAHREYDN